jgi:hypothetical protein
VVIMAAEVLTNTMPIQFTLNQEAGYFEKGF